MIKKVLVSTLLVGLVGGFTVGGDAVSYVSTACSRAVDGFERSVPTEFQLDRARQMLKDLGPEIRRSREVVAAEEIALERIGEQIERATEKTDKMEGEVARLTADLTSDRNVFRYASGSYSRAEVTKDLEGRFKRLKLEDETLEHLQEMYQARQNNLQAAQKKLSMLAAEQRNLETEITNLDAQRQLVEVAQASSNVVALDDSKLSRVKGLLTDIRSRLDVAARLASAETVHTGQIEIGPAESTDLLEEVASYLGDKQGGSEEAATVLAKITIE